MAEDKANSNIRSKTGKFVSDITLDAVLRGDVTADDIKISRDVLKKQAQTALASERRQLSENFIRASEMVNIPDSELLDMYNLLRPKRATKAQLIDLAARLRDEYSAESCAGLVLEAAEVYDRRSVLL